MDNAYILLLIIKKRLNIGIFINWYNSFVIDKKTSLPKYSDYLDYTDVFAFSLGDCNLTEFEFSYLTSYLRLRGELS